MKRLPLLTALSAALLAGCAAVPDRPEMSAAELAECLQPNRRVVVEVNGLVPKPPAKKPAAKPEEAKPAAEAPKPKPAKPAFAPYEETLYVQGNSAFDVGGAALKDDARAEIDKFLAGLNKRQVRINAVIISGHTDRLEAEGANAQALSEQRARAVKDYLVSRGIDEKLVFWEGKGARDPVPVTKFCA